VLAHSPKRTTLIAGALSFILFLLALSLSVNSEFARKKAIDNFYSSWKKSKTYFGLKNQENLYFKKNYQNNFLEDALVENLKKDFQIHFSQNNYSAIEFVSRFQESPRFASLMVKNVDSVNKNKELFEEAIRVPNNYIFIAAFVFLIILLFLQSEAWALFFFCLLGGLWVSQYQFVDFFPNLVKAIGSLDDSFFRGKVEKPLSLLNKSVLLFSVFFSLLSLVARKFFKKKLWSFTLRSAVWLFLFFNSAVLFYVFCLQGAAQVVDFLNASVEVLSYQYLSLSLLLFSMAAFLTQKKNQWSELRVDFSFHVVQPFLALLFLFLGGLGWFSSVVSVEKIIGLHAFHLLLVAALISFFWGGSFLAYFLGAFFLYPQLESGGDLSLALKQWSFYVEGIFIGFLLRQLISSQSPKLLAVFSFVSIILFSLFLPSSLSLNNFIVWMLLLGVVFLFLMFQKKNNSLDKTIKSL